MAKYRLSKRADADLESIALWGMDVFGVDQTLRFLEGLKERFDQIAQTPLMFPSVDQIRSGYRRSVYKGQSIYFMIDEGGVLIVRILGRHDPVAGLSEG